MLPLVTRNRMRTRRWTAFAGLWDSMRRERSASPKNTVPMPCWTGELKRIEAVPR